MKAFETTAVVENPNSIHLDRPLEKTINGKVHVLIFTDEDEVSESEWMQAAANNPAYDFLKDPAEDVYSLIDGIPWNNGSKI